MLVPHVQTLVQELNAGTISLEKSKNLVSSFNATGAKGLAVVREAGEAKMTEIRAHMAKIRQILVRSRVCARVGACRSSARTDNSPAQPLPWTKTDTG